MNPTFNLKVPFKILATGETIDISPVSSAIEKSALEVQAISDADNLDLVCEMYKIPANLPVPVKLAGLLKVREISSGSDCSLKYKCPCCGRITENVILLEDMLDFSHWEEVQAFKDLKLTDYGMQNLDKLHKCSSFELLRFFEVDPTGFSLADFAQLKISAIARVPVFKESIDSRCILCGDIKKVRVDEEFVLKSLCTHDLKSLYQTYTKLVLNGFTKADVDGMLPFEREVQSGIIDRIIEDRKPQSN